MSLEVSIVFLLTPLREGRPAEIVAESVYFGISTHAPAGGATWAAMAVAVTYFISTHAPAGGATIAGVNRQNCSHQFLLTPLREGRRNLGAFGIAPDADFYSRPCGRGDMSSWRRSKRRICLISTHAPAGGATAGVLYPALTLGNFYSRPCGRGDSFVR